MKALGILELVDLLFQGLDSELGGSVQRVNLFAELDELLHSFGLNTERVTGGPKPDANLRAGILERLQRHVDNGGEIRSPRPQPSVRHDGQDADEGNHDEERSL